MRRLLTWLIVLGILGGGLATAGYFGRKYLTASAIPRYTTAKVSTGKIETVVNSTGPIKPVQTVTVGSFVSGPIRDILVGFNDVVTEKQVLARIDPRLLQASLDRENAFLKTMQADLARIESQLLQAERNEARGDNLRKKNENYISQQELDQLHFARLVLGSQKKLAQANIESAQAGVNNAKTNRDYCDILSPVNGIVIERKVEPGQTVASSFQTPELFIIAPNLDTMHVYAAVDEADIGQIVTAQEQKRTVQFTVDAYPEIVFTGTIYQVRMNATVTQNVVTYPVIVEAPNPGRKLRPQMTANVSFQTDVREKAIRIPNSAIRFVPLESMIYPEDKKYIEVKVKKDPKEGEDKISAERRAEQAKDRSKRVVWARDKENSNKVRAVPITIGLTDGQFAELVEGDIQPDQELVTGLEGSEKR